MIRSILLALVLAGCASTSHTVLVDRPAPVFPEPAPAAQQPYGWVVITRENVNEIFTQLEAEGGTVVLFAVTPEGYSSLNMNMAELRRYIQQQDAIVEGYRVYAETPVTQPTRRPLFRLQNSNQ